jgi:WD40 repeat protein
MIKHIYTETKMNREILFLLTVLFFNCSIGYSQKIKDFFAYPTESTNILDMCFSGNGEILCIADNNAIKVFMTNTQELITEFKDGHKNQIQTIDLSQDSLLLISGGRDGTVVIWDFINRNKLKTLSFQNSIITSIKISPNSKFFISGGMDKIHVYDIENEKFVYEIENNSIVTCISFSPDGKTFATSNSDKSVKIFEVNTGKLLAQLIEHTNWVRSLTFNNDGTLLISCGDDSKVVIWDISNLNDIKLFSKSRYGLKWLLSVDFYQDNKTYAFANFKGTAGIITQFASYKTGVNSLINKILFKPNEEDVYLKIAVATRGRGVLLIDAKNMKSKSF